MKKIIILFAAALATASIDFGQTKNANEKNNCGNSFELVGFLF